ncbi:MAG: XRE family transcriptional regulator [Chloroflexales bacterium]|jgi:antitoxin HicB
MNTNPHIGSSLDDLLREEESYEQVNEVAIKRVLAWQIDQAMQQQTVSKSALAERMQTSRTSLDRLLDPENTAVTLKTLARAAKSLGKRLHIEITD